MRKPSTAPVYQSEAWESTDIDASQFISSTTHYVFAAIIFAVYGVQVCPLLETLTPVHLVLPILFALVGRYLLLGRVINDTSGDHVTKQFRLDLSLFAAAALGLVAVNLYLYGAPWHSNAKVIVGTGILGLFVSIDLALKREQFFALELIRQNRELDITRRFNSFAKKLFFMAIFVVASISVVLFLVVSKDLDWLLNDGLNFDRTFARNSVMAEIGFIMLVLLAYSIQVVHSYVSNLKMYLAHQNGVLQEVLKGNLQIKVPVTSTDEFGAMAKGTNAMIESLRAHQSELQQTRDVSILALASLAETRDNETGAHILRTQRYVRALAKNLKYHEDFKHILDDETIELLFKSAPLHDVGKVGIPDDILLKPGKLTEDEFEVMKKHAQMGADALLIAESELGSNSFLRLAREIAANHHEKWDGSGYPNGIKGDEIPLSARLMALADVYDALISKRIYKPAFPHLKAKEIIMQGEGSHFDPRVVNAFLACEDEFQEIAKAYQDSLKAHQITGSLA